MEHFRSALRSLTQRICRELEGQEVPKKPIWTVVNPPDTAPYVAMDVERPALSDLHFGLSIGLLRLPEYVAVAEAVENAPGLREGIIVDAGGFLRGPERMKFTRDLVTNFLWRYLRNGNQLDWDETRFVETFKELEVAIRDKSVVSHTTWPLSNLKMGIDALDFGEELKLLPASTEEFERWLNPDRNFPQPGGGPPQWNTQYVDRPAVLHAHQIIVGRPPSTDPHAAMGTLPRVNADHAVTALRLVLNAPISVIFQEHNMEGLMAFGGGGTAWGWWSPPPFGPLATLDQEKAAQVIHVWQLLQTSPNIGLLRLPLRRWESSLLRANLEDKLIDAWISLEALLMPGITSELTYRAALRLAELLGKDGPNRQAIYDAAQDSYGWRSKIVHGSLPKNTAKQNKLADTVRVTTEYVRETLLKVLDLTGPFDPSKLESDMLGRDAQAH